MSGIADAPVAASGVLTATGNFTANDTVIVAGQTYTFVASPAVANDVDLGVDLATSLENLEGAINGDFEVGEAHASTVAAPGVTAVAAATTLTLTADVGGAYGNGIDFREGTDGGGTFSITTAMASGSGDLQAYIDSIISSAQLNSGVIEALAAL